MKTKTEIQEQLNYVIKDVVGYALAKEFRVVYKNEQELMRYLCKKWGDFGDWVYDTDTEEEDNYYDVNDPPV